MPADYITHLSVTCAGTRNYVQTPGIANIRMYITKIHHYRLVMYYIHDSHEQCTRELLYNNCIERMYERHDGWRMIKF